MREKFYFSKNMCRQKLCIISIINIFHRLYWYINYILLMILLYIINFAYESVHWKWQISI